MSYLEKLIGKKVKSIVEETTETFPFNTVNKTDSSDQERKDEQSESTIDLALKLVFDDYALEIYNIGEIVGTESQSVKTLQGLVVRQISETKKEAIISFDNGVKLKVSLDPKMFKGAEAMCLYGPDNLIVVWNGGE